MCRPKTYCALSFLLAVALVGCQGGKSAKVEVSGIVNFKGAAVPDGNIVFRNEDKAIPAEASPISSGAFSIRVVPGNYIVEILASKKMPFPDSRRGPMGETEGWQNYLDEKYNSKSELKRQVTGPAKLTFDLE